LIKIRKMMKEKNLDGLIIPNNDPHKNEYLAEKYKNIQKISNFKGSNAICFIT
jgi:hypothetical protein